MEYFEIIQKKWPNLTVIKVAGPKYEDLIWNQFDVQKAPTKKELDDAITAYTQEQVITQSTTGELQFQDICAVPGTFSEVIVSKKGLVTQGESLTSSDIIPLLGNGIISNTMISNNAVSNLSGVNTGDQTITLTGDVTGTGNGSFLTTLANSGVTAGSYTGSITVNAKGVITAASNLSTNDIELAMVGTGGIIQTIYSVVPATTGTTTITLNNSTPTTSTGSRIWTNSIIPSSSTSDIKLTGSFTFVSGTASRTLIALIFRNTTCIGVVGTFAASASQPMPVVINIVDSPASTSSVTYSIRVGVTSSATWYINQFANPYFAGKMATSVISLHELA